MGDYQEIILKNKHSNLGWVNGSPLAGLDINGEDPEYFDEFEDWYNQNF